VKSSKKDVQPYWRPNFVDASSLPDIKVIRTDFIINILALVLMLIVGFFLLQREFRAYTLGKTIQLLEREIRVSEADDSINIKLSEEFKQSAKHVAEMERFYLSPVLAHEFLAWLALVRPENLIFRQVSMSEAVVNQGGKVLSYRINISGDVRSLTTLDEFKGELAAWEKLNLKGYVLDVDEALQGRDAETGIFPFTLEITLTPEKKEEGDE